MFLRVCNQTNFNFRVYGGRLGLERYPRKPAKRSLSGPEFLPVAERCICSG